MIILKEPFGLWIWKGWAVIMKLVLCVYMLHFSVLCYLSHLYTYKSVDHCLKSGGFSLPSEAYLLLVKEGQENNKETYLCGMSYPDYENDGFLLWKHDKESFKKPLACIVGFLYLSPKTILKLNNHCSLCNWQKSWKGHWGLILCNCKIRSWHFYAAYNYMRIKRLQKIIAQNHMFFCPPV